MSVWEIKLLVYGTIEIKKDQLTDGPEATLRLTIPYFDYCLNSEMTMVLGMWVSFFDTEEAHAVMLAYPEARKAADEGGLPWRDDTGI